MLPRQMQQVMTLRRNRPGKTTSQLEAITKLPRILMTADLARSHLAWALRWPEWLLVPQVWRCCPQLEVAIHHQMTVVMKAAITVMQVHDLSLQLLRC